jgi:hypothetical protein
MVCSGSWQQAWPHVFSCLTKSVNACTSFALPPTPCRLHRAGFIDINKQVFSNASPPKPRVLHINRMHPDFKRFIDWKRVSYLRTMQHERISSLMTDEEKQRIKSEGKPILQDKQFLQSIADRSAIYIDHEVKDCVQGYLETRDHMRRMYRWVVVLGEPEPVTQVQQKRALEEMKALEEDGELGWLQ